MGIANLLKELRPITNTHCHVSQFEGQTCAVDASCWLHRASYSCALQLISGERTTKYLNFTQRCIQLFQHFNISLIMVFDGAQLPMKRGEEQKRRALREDNKRKALEAMKAGDRESAWKYASGAVRVTNEMVTAVMNQCIANDVRIVCAPFEADAQLAHLYRNKECDVVITEDSDLLLFGVGRAFYKLDVGTGYGHLLDLQNICQYQRTTNNNNKNSKHKKNKQSTPTDLCAFLKKSSDMQNDLIKVCVLSGCDYVQSLPGIGLKTALKLCSQYKRTESMLHSLVTEKHESAPPDYRVQFMRAVLTFKHQTVYNTQQRELTHLTPIDDDAINAYYCQVQKYSKKQQQQGKDEFDVSLDFLGKLCDPNTARLVAEGALDARSLQPRKLIDKSSTSAPQQRQSQPAKIDGENSAKANIFGLLQSSDSATQKKRNRNCPQSRTKQKYFQQNDDNKRKCLDGGLQTKLDDLMQEFGVTAEANDDETAAVFGANSDGDDPDANVNHQPLQKSSRNRKRSRTALQSMEADTFANHSPIVHEARKRKLNNGLIQRTKTPTARPAAVASSAPSTRDDDGGSLISDLCRSRKTKKTETKTSVADSNDKENKSSSNPFSVSRGKKSIAMIGAEHKPINNEEEEEEHVAQQIEKHARNEAFYEIDSDDGDCDGIESTEVQSTHLSLSESDRETDKLLREFHASQQSEERKDHEEDGDEDDDDDLQVLSANRKDICTHSDSLSMTKITKNESHEAATSRFKPKPFKPPRLSKAKTQANSMQQKKWTKNANKSKSKSKNPNQMTLMAMWAAKK